MAQPILRTRPTLAPSVLLGSSRRGRWPQPLDGSGVTLHVKARNAIWHVLRALDVKQSEAVLLPSYNCGAELDAVLRTPARACFYRVDGSAEIDVDDLRRAMTPRARAVLVTHYFGFPQPDLPAIVDLCHEQDLFVIEDCAHALYSTYHGRPLGTFGDAGIFSLWKTLPLPDGAAAVADGRLHLREGTDAPPLESSLVALRVSLEAHLLLRFGRAGAVVNALVDRLAPFARRAVERFRGEGHPAPVDLDAGLNPHVTFDLSTADWSMSAVARRIARRSRHAEIAARRRRNYAFLAEELAALPAVRPLRPALPDGVCPLAFALLVEEPGSLLDRLAADGVGAELFWSDFHPAFPAREFPESAYLKTHVVALPIHQDLDPDLLARVSGVVRRWSQSR